MKILHEIKNSIYNPEYYKSLPAGKSMRSSIKYLAKLSLLVSLVSVILICILFASFPGKLKEWVRAVGETYPADLVITVKDGMASSNKAEPYIIPLKTITLPEEAGAPAYSNLLVVDTSKSFSVEEFMGHSTILMVTKTEIVTRGNNDKIELRPLPKFSSLVITKSWVSEKEALIGKFLPIIMIALCVFSLLGFFMINFTGSLIILIFYGFLVWLMGKMMKVELSYKNSYKIGIHATTLLILLSLVHPYIPFLNNFFVKMVIFLCVAYANFFAGRSREAEIAA